MKTLVTVFLLFFTSFILLPETNNLLKYTFLSLDRVPFSLGKYFAASKNVKHLCRGQALIYAYHQNQAILPNAKSAKKKVFILRNSYSVVHVLFVKFSANRLGPSAKERTPI